MNEKRLTPEQEQAFTELAVCHAPSPTNGMTVEEWKREYRPLIDRLVAASSSNTEGEPVAMALCAMIREMGDGFWGNEFSEDLMPILVQHGYAERAKYDPEKHGDNIEADPGDEIWMFTGKDKHHPTPPNREGEV